MPTYEYACKSCGEHLEVVQSFRDDALTECPNCGGVLRKVFGSIGISFKGSGFYKTDSRSTTAASSGSSPESKGGETKGGESKSETKGESKSDAKTPAATSGSSSSASSSTPAAS